MDVKFGFFTQILAVLGGGTYEQQFNTAEIKRWYVKVGDKIKTGDVLCNVEMDKVSADLPSLFDGVIKNLNYEEGEKWERGPEEETSFGALITPELGIMEIEEGNGVCEEQNDEFASAVAPKESVIALKLEEQKKKRFLVTAVAQKMMQANSLTIENVLHLFPNKTKIEKEDVEAYLAKLKDTEMRIRRETERDEQKPAEETAPIVPQPEKDFTQGAIVAIPAARRLAKERGIDLASIKGSGEGGIITLEDVEKIRVLDTEPMQISPLLPANFVDAELIIPATEIRKTIAEFLTYSWTKIPHAGDEITIDITALAAERDAVKEIWKRVYNTEIKYDHFIMYFVAQNILRKEFSVLNAYWEESRYNIMAPLRVNLGIAVQTNDGLVVPVVHSAEKMGFVEFVRTANQKVEHALLRKLALADFRDLTVTVNRVAFFDEVRGEVIGGEKPSPIIPTTIGSNGKKRPTTLILAFGKIKEENGRKLLTVVFRFDHRITDGAIPLRFVYALKDFLEKDCANSKKFAEIITCNFSERCLQSTTKVL